MSTLTLQTANSKPWYRQPWVWFVIAIPTVTVLTNILLLVLASGGADGLVVDDYYKEGLAINQRLEREARADALQIAAEVRLEPSTGVVSLALQGQTPSALQLRFVHPTRSDLDQQLQMLPDATGRYHGLVTTLQPGRWDLILQPEDGQWRVTGRAIIESETTTFSLQP